MIGVGQPYHRLYWCDVARPTLQSQEFLFLGRVVEPLLCSRGCVVDS